MKYINFTLFALAAMSAVNIIAGDKPITGPTITLHNCDYNTWGLDYKFIGDQKKYVEGKMPKGAQSSEKITLPAPKADNTYELELTYKTLLWHHAHDLDNKPKVFVPYSPSILNPGTKPDLYAKFIKYGKNIDSGYFVSTNKNLCTKSEDEIRTEYIKLNNLDQQPTAKAK